MINDDEIYIRNYDDNFLAVSNYALNNNITSKYQTELNETVELIKKRIKK